MRNPVLKIIQTVHVNLVQRNVHLVKQGINFECQKKKKKNSYTCPDQTAHLCMQNLLVSEDWFVIYIYTTVFTLL